MLIQIISPTCVKCSWEFNLHKNGLKAEGEMIGLGR